MMFYWHLFQTCSGAASAKSAGATNAASQIEKGIMLFVARHGRAALSFKSHECTRAIDRRICTRNHSIDLNLKVLIKCCGLVST